MIVGIRFRPSGQLYFFSASMPLSEGNAVIVETEQGIGFGHVAVLRDTVPQELQDLPLSPIVRMASAEDCQIAQDNMQLSQEAFQYCKNCIAERGLDMKLVDVEVFFDRSKCIFYFTAPLRIDFRELVKDLVREYRTRIELRQIGVRHETQMIGAVGSCGMVCCCRRYLRKFAPVTIRMAKEQSLFLNSAKISGICGRLLCCLSFEQENYDNFHNQCPKLGKKYQTTRGPMKVLRSNLFRHAVIVLNENNEEIEMPLEEWQAINPQRPEKQEGQGGQKNAKGGQKSTAQGDGLLVITMDDPDGDAMAYTEDPYDPSKKTVQDLETCLEQAEAKAEPSVKPAAKPVVKPVTKTVAAPNSSAPTEPEGSEEPAESTEPVEYDEAEESTTGGIFGLAPQASQNSGASQGAKAEGQRGNSNQAKHGHKKKKRK